jgi:hypothetical protein
MSTYKITFATLISNYAVVETLTPTDVAVGQAITVSSVSASFNGSQTVYAIPQYRFIGIDSDGDLEYDFNEPIANQVLYYMAASDVTRFAVIPQGSLVYTQTCSWITGPNVATWLGIDLAGSDETLFHTQCANAANNFIYLRRQESGYTDSLTTSPGTQVTLATTMYAGALYRQRGSIDQFASFSEMGTAPTTGLSPIIKQLAGIPRPAVA